MALHLPISTATLPQLNLPLYERIRIDIQARLVEQGWDPDLPIPTEQMLAQEYQVSIGTIRKAIDRLVQEGMLYKAQGRGTFIKQPDFKNSLLRFFRFRNHEGKQAVPTGMVKSIRKVPPTPAINKHLLIDEGMALIELQRLRIVENKVVLSEQIWLPEHLFSDLLHFEPLEFGNLLYPFYYQHCGQFISTAKETLSFTSEVEDTDLNARKGDMLIQIERLAYNLENRPVEYRISLGRPESFKYEVKIS